MNLCFRQLRPAEEDWGYQVLCGNVAWQKEKSIGLWDEPLPRKAYAERHARGENFGLFVDGQLVVIVSLVAGVPPYWRREVPDPGAIWLCTLATGTDFHGRGLGRTAVKEAVAYLRRRGQGSVYLDCKPGFLERLYESLGFVRAASGIKHIPHGAGQVFLAVLWRKAIGPDARHLTLDA